MNICITHLRHAYTGGAERYLNALAKGLCERGHEVTIACRSHAVPPHPRVKFARLHPFAIGGAWRHWGFAKALSQWLATEPSRFDVVVGLGRTWSQDVLRVGGGCHQTWLDQISQSNPGTDSTKPRFKDRVYLRLEARSFEAGAYRKIICNSRMVRRDVMQRYAVPDDAIQVIYNGVDLERFNPRNAYDKGRQIRHEAGFSENDVVFTFLGTGFERKGVDLLLSAFAQIASTVDHARVLIIGKDSRLSVYQQQAHDLGIANKVVFLGERLDAQDCLAAGDVLVLPTRYDPFANVTVEALASGLPVITSDTNGGSEILSGEVGSVIPMGKNVINELAQAMQDWSDPTRVRSASAAARKIAEQHSIESKLDAAIQLIHEVADQRA